MSDFLRCVIVFFGGLAVAAIISIPSALLMMLCINHGLHEWIPAVPKISFVQSYLLMWLLTFVKTNFMQVKKDK